MDYIATFYTHSGAIKFNRFLLKNNISNETLPVPRQLSSNCGIGVSFSYENNVENIFTDDMEKLYLCNKDNFKLIKTFE
ncbi:MAG TPA: hypothetical protein DIU45_19045 [Clostridium sp.]|nr:hypothetical protein [Clostridium sp.]